MSNKNVRAKEDKDTEVPSARYRLLVGFMFGAPLPVVPLLTLLFYWVS